MTGQQHVPIIFFLDELFEIAPALIVHGFGDGRLSIDIHQSVRDDGELAVTGGQVEVVHEIAARIRIAENARAGIDGELKNEAALIALAPGVHADFHHALPDELAVAIAREMANGVKHQL